MPQPVQKPMDIQMRLDLDFSAAGPEGTPLRAGFTQSLTQDLSNSTSVHSANFHILKMAPGSIILDIRIQSDPQGRGQVPLMVAKDLQMQVQDPTSPLLNGKLTSYAKSITLLGFAQHTFDDDGPDLLPAVPSQFSPFSGDLREQDTMWIVDPRGHSFEASGNSVAGVNPEMLAALLEDSMQAELEAELAEEEYNQALRKSVGMLALDVSEEQYYKSLIDDVRQAQMDADAADDDYFQAIGRSVGAPLQTPYFVHAQVCPLSISQYVWILCKRPY